ncbi:MAG: DUF305 domain-containing protein [Gemmatimonadota bacterium]|nr:DUF305 domain-containing protein [Gemmatimonadota bacterium]
MNRRGISRLLGHTGVVGAAFVVACGGSATGGVGARDTPPRVVQAGAPGSDARILDEAGKASLASPGFTGADVAFMQGMIPHHAQALEMTALTGPRNAGEAVRRMALRMEISQRDEIALMERWLEARGAGGTQGGHRLMPGMLTHEQMADLRGAEGDDFDRLFLEYMIQHHEGALAMVATLFATPGAAQESEVFQFANDVDVDQRMEIARMRALLNDMR